jgi:glycosyltransferase involved in cell wall biosynthesis
VLIALIADAFPPIRTSCAVQLRDLSLELVKQGHQPIVIIPSFELTQPWSSEDFQGVQVLRLKAPKTKDINYVRRTIGEFLMPFVMLRNFRKSPFAAVKWDGVVWYSPTIFLGPFSKALKKMGGVRSYLILRDIFPEWAVNMGLMGRGLPYRFFKAVEDFQYSVADVIGVQTPANVAYFDSWKSQHNGRVEVLQNWLADAPNVGCSISVAASPLVGRTIFVYAGNMGVAQGMGVLLELAERLHSRKDIGFVFVGRGSDAQRLRLVAENRGLDNVVFFDEIDPTEIPGLYAQCHVGIVALDPRHKTHNIPGKFLSYMQAGLPVLASINPGNDLEEMINYEGVGRVCTDHSAVTMQRLAIDLLDEVTGNTTNNQAVSARCKALSAKLFSPEVAVKQILSALAS